MTILKLWLRNAKKKNEKKSYQTTNKTTFIGMKITIKFCLKHNYILDQSATLPHPYSSSFKNREEL